MNRVFTITLLFGFLFCGTARGQLSSGGTPRKIAPLKRGTADVVTMPAVSNEFLMWRSRQIQEEAGGLKPLRFAHTFEVQFSPSTHGSWNLSEDGWHIWQFTIRSEGALSLNLIFERFALPGQARMYLFTSGQQFVSGAFTARNNSESGIFSVSPLPGDELTVQYEIPEHGTSVDDFVITAVNHDFLGILKYVDERRPMGIMAESCNQDVNCAVADRWRAVQNSVCRIMVQGRDLCSGALVNNTAKNAKPYVLTANHCISTSLKANGSLFLFNYESPYCGPLDGDVSHSLSGSKLKATLDSLDFSLVELSTPPPPSFRPYYAGWNRSSIQPDTMASIHHPQGDIKKIAIDYQSPAISSFQSGFLKNGFRKVQRWDAGTTEIGSSGGPLFNSDSQLTGTLSGGAANCANPVNDYFARFDMAWNYRSDSTKQLKYWLDPAKTNPTSLDGKQFNEGENLCGTYTHMRNGDHHELLRMMDTNGVNSGYWSGTNNSGITEVAEKFSLPGRETLRGVSLGIGKIKNDNPNSYLTIKIFDVQGEVISLRTVADTVFLKNFFPDAMNLLEFASAVQPVDTFLVAVNLENIRTGDTVAIYHSLRTDGPENSFFLKRNGSWQDFYSTNPSRYHGNLAMELLACNIGNQNTDTFSTPEPDPAFFYPTVVTSTLHILTKDDIDEHSLFVCNLLGQQVPFYLNRISRRHVEINLRGNTPGIYIVNVGSGAFSARHKILLVRDR